MSTSKFISCFINQVEIGPGHTAIDFAGESISYKELLDKSVAVCEYLKVNSTKEKFIAVLPVGGFQDYSNIIGVWMFGAAYVPINTQYPKETVNQMMADLGIMTILRGDQKENLYEDVLNGEKEGDKRGLLRDDLAYVIHTSGSTGKPKSVLISHENLNAFTDHYMDKSRYDFNKNDRFLQSYELSFDVSVFCFSIPLMIGATLVLPQDKGVKYMTILSSIIKDKITVCSNVPSVAKYAFPRMGQLSLHSLRYCFFSGEALFGTWALAWLKAAKNAQVYNCYGPTETTIVCTREHLNAIDSAYFESNEPMPLGKPFDGMELELINEEIFLKGLQIFNGYGNISTTNSSLTDKGFFPTGDMAILDDNGKLIFKGRKDEQIQIDGYRIELGAIDTLIQKNFNFHSKSIVVKHTKKRDEIITVIESEEAKIEKIINGIKDQLPPYGLPSKIFKIQEFPLNVNGKLDVILLKKWAINNLSAK